jgi:hypothetical protein
MPRTLAANNIRAWRTEQLINDMAEGSKSYAVLADEYDVVEQSVRAFRQRHKADVEAKKRDLSSEYSHIWSIRSRPAQRVLAV